MKPDSEEPNDAFEGELARFRREPPPASWRDELIANASPGARKRFPRFRPASKKLLAGTAAAWAASAALWIATPVDETDYAGRGRLEDRERVPFPPVSRPILAWRASTLASFENQP